MDMSPDHAFVFAALGVVALVLAACNALSYRPRQPRPRTLAAGGGRVAPKKLTGGRNPLHRAIHLQILPRVSPLVLDHATGRVYLELLESSPSIRSAADYRALDAVLVEAN